MPEIMGADPEFFLPDIAYGLSGIQISYAHSWETRILLLLSAWEQENLCFSVECAITDTAVISGRKVILPTGLQFRVWLQSYSTNLLTRLALLTFYPAPFTVLEVSALRFEGASFLLVILLFGIYLPPLIISSLHGFHHADFLSPFTLSSSRIHGVSTHLHIARYIPEKLIRECR